MAACGSTSTSTSSSSCLGNSYKLCLQSSATKEPAARPTSCQGLFSLLLCLRGKLPSDLIQRIVGDFVLTHAKFASHLIRKFRFVPWTVLRSRHQMLYRNVILYGPKFQHHKSTYEGYQQTVSFTRCGYPYVKYDVSLNDRVVSNDFLYGNFLDVNCLTEDEKDAISNGLRPTTWDGLSIESVRYRFFNDDAYNLCFGMVAAGLRDMGIAGSCAGLERDALLLHLPEDTPFCSVQSKQEYPFLELATLGALLKDPDSYLRLNFIATRIPGNMEILWAVVQKGHPDVPDLVHRFIKYIKWGLQQEKLKQTPLTDRILQSEELLQGRQKRCKITEI